MDDGTTGKEMVRGRQGFHISEEEEEAAIDPNMHREARRSKNGLVEALNRHDV